MAAAWVAHERAKATAKAAGKSLAPAPSTKCEACGGRNADIAGDPIEQRCTACGGLGWIPAAEPGLTDGAVASVSDFLVAWGLVEKYGPQGALCLLGSDEWDPAFVDALGIFDAELNRIALEQ